MTDASPEDAARTYDEVPYESSSYSWTQPDRMAAVATLFGMAPRDPARSRVLELGCAGGGNLLPLALRYPDSSFLGLDISKNQIAFAEADRAQLGVTNITFKREDILAFDISAHRGAFDYIICHGVYSWAPEIVAERVLELCRECLSDQGIALISFNTLPGWNAVRSIREMMRFHTMRFSSPSERVVESRKFLDFLAETSVDPHFRSIVDEERDMLRTQDDSYIYHDHLEGVNRQFYIHEFIGSLQAHGLAYVGDSHINTMYVGNLPPQAMQALSAVNDMTLQEQYMDFITNRRFRTAIVCKAEAPLQHALDNAKIMDFHLTALMRPEGDKPDFKHPTKFVDANGAFFTTTTEIAGTLFDEIVRSGLMPIAATELVVNVQRRLGLPSPEPVKEELVNHGLRLALAGFLHLHMGKPAFVRRVSARPVAFPLARIQAQRPRCRAVSNAAGDMMAVDELTCRIIAQLDGSKTVADMADDLANAALSGAFEVRSKDQVITDREELQRRLRVATQNLLAQLAERAILVG